MSDLHIVSTDTENGRVTVQLQSPDGRQFRLSLNSIDVASLIGSLRLSLEEAIGHPSAESAAIPMHHVQYQESPENLFFRVFVTDRIYHEYPVPRDTTLSVALKVFADRYEAEELALAMRLSPGSTKN